MLQSGEYSPLLRHPVVERGEEPPEVAVKERESRLYPSLRAEAVVLPLAELPHPQFTDVSVYQLGRRLPLSV